MQFRTGRRTTIAALLSAAGLVAGSGFAVADISPQALPGTGDDSIQFAVGHDDLAEVTVGDVDETTTVVQGTFTNTSDATLTCGNPDSFGDDVAVTVTEADLVNRSSDYLTGNLVSTGGGLNIPGLDIGSLNNMLVGGSLGSLGLGDPAAYELSQIQQAQDDARLAGHYGTAGMFTVDAEESADWSATLPVPSGDRTDFDAGALITCEQDGQWYVFTGFEDEDGDGGGGDSSGSLSMGSLGS